MKTIDLFQSTHPSWGATLTKEQVLLRLEISIHAPIVGCDSIAYDNSLALKLISIHAPIVGCDLSYFPSAVATALFQSTHPSWGATGKFLKNVTTALIFQSTHPSWGATPDMLTDLAKYIISIHAPIVGCDVIRQCNLITCNSNFNPRTHRGVRLSKLFISFPQCHISIHAPIVGCDCTAPRHFSISKDFNPRTHRGVRQRKPLLIYWMC